MYVWYVIGNRRSRTCQQCEEETRQWWCRSACHLRRTPQAFAWLRWRSCTHLSLVVPPSCSCIAVPWSVAHPPERNAAEETFVINKLSMLLQSLPCWVNPSSQRPDLWGWGRSSVAAGDSAAWWYGLSSLWHPFGSSFGGETSGRPCSSWRFGRGRS